METNNIGEKNTFAFLEKIKKQAKRLLKFSKEQELKIEIKNLSDAQNLLAKINGYPDWHALEKNLSQQNIENNKRLKIDNNQDIVSLIYHENVNFTEIEDNILSFFDIHSIQSQSYESASTWIKAIKDSLSFKWNMCFHNIQISLNYTSQEKQEEEKQHYFIKWSSILGVSEKIIEELFEIKLQPNSKTFKLQATLIVSTNKNQKEEHIDFCKDIIKLRDTFIIKNQISMNEFSNLFINDEDVLFYNENSAQRESELNIKNLISTDKKNNQNNENINWIYALSSIYQKNMSLKINVNLGTYSQTIKIALNKEQEIKQRLFLNGLWSSLNKQEYKNLNADNYIYLSSDNKYNKLPWDSGVPLINKTDNNIVYWNAGLNSLQTTANTLIYGPPGSGKSILANIANLQSTLNKEILPYVSIIDIGASSKGYISMLKNIVNDKDKNKIKYIKWDLTKEFCINPFDTELGQRFPSVTQKVFLTNFITLLVSISNVEPGVLGLVNSVIDLTYKKWAYDIPKYYEPEKNKQIDDLLISLNYDIEKSTWWNVVDFLFNNNKIKEAKIAQRYAVPLLCDLVSNLSELRSIYGKATVSTGETIIQYVAREITDALNYYPILGRETVFDLDDAKIIVIDLDNVAKSGGTMDQHKTSVMYMLASFALRRNAGEFLVSDIEEGYNTKYSKYITEKKAYFRNIPSRFVFEEFHRTSKHELVLQEIKFILKESRKYGHEILVSTQSLEDCEIISELFSTVIWSAVSNGSPLQIKEAFNIEDQHIIKELKNRQGKFNEWYIKINHISGVTTKKIEIKITPMIIWMNSSTYEDVLFRDEVLKKFDYFTTIKKLAATFPNGVKGYVETLKNDNPDIEDKYWLNNLMEIMAKRNNL